MLNGMNYKAGSCHNLLSADMTVQNTADGHILFDFSEIYNNFNLISIYKNSVI